MVTQTGKVLGIKITPEYDTEIIGGHKVPFGVHFSFSIAKGLVADPLFYSTIRLQGVLTKHPELFGKPMGHWSFSVSASNNRRVFAENVFPFAELGKNRRFFIKKGFARALQRKCLARVVMNFGPKIIIEPSWGLASLRRRKQLSRMGVKVRDTLPRYSVSAIDLLNKSNALHRSDKKRQVVKRTRP